MILTIAQVVESFFIAVLLVLATSPQLLNALHAGQNVLQLFHHY